ncbi:hypothetical protein BXZ70DRAFT_517738 [Cristinia sonorae]|uniref:Uncharacterized protein n=1 Tax=Cristinia sonorae TaxID=1940300 RepID=A0A8K0UWM0_9AGAR|nr:hypothetical protein BXZ70DRAFT_517738 [Cristinia sonorae]
MNTPPASVSSSDLPPARQRKGLRSVKPPLHSISMRRFNYYIALAATLIFAIYVYRIMQWKADAGGWWNLALGKKPPAVQNMQDARANWKAGPEGNSNNAGDSNVNVKQEFGGDADVERRINELAAALGLPSKDLASAIAGAVREYVPPASISSIAAHQTGDAVKFIVDPSGASSSEAANQPGATAAHAYQAVAAAFEAAVGLDEPPSEVGL